MVFTLGNLLTLLIVFLFFVLLRWFDRANRKLDMARDYGKQLKEQLKDELSKFVQDREKAIRNYGVNLEVEVNAAKTLKTNIDELLAELRARSGDIETINTKITGYSASLKELSAMTDRVQENLLRIEHESLFVEETAQKISIIKNDIHKIETDINGMKSRIEENIIASVEKAAVSIEKNAGEILEPVRGMVDELRISAEAAEKQVRAHREIIEQNVQEQCAEIEKAEAKRSARVEKDMQAITSLLNDAAFNAEKRAGAIENDIYEKLIYDAQERAEEIKKSAHKKIDEAFFDVDGRIAEISAITDTINGEREKWQAVKNQLEAEIEALKGGAEEQIAHLKHEIEKTKGWSKEEVLSVESLITSHKTMVDSRLNEITDNLEKHAEEAKFNALRIADEQLEEYRQAGENRIKKLIAVSDDAENLEKELRRYIDDVHKRIQNEYTQFEEESQQRRGALASEWEVSIDAIKTNITSLSSELNGIKAEAAANVTEKINLYEDAFNLDIQKRKDKIETLFDEWLAGAHDRLETLQKETENEYRQTEISAADAWRKNLAEIENRLSGELSRLKDETALFEKGIREEMRLADKSVETLKEQLEGSLKDARSSAEFELKTAIAQHTVESGNKLKEYKNDLDSGLKTMTAQMEEKAQELSRKLDAARREAEQVDANVKEKLDGVAADAERRINICNSDIENRMQEAAKNHAAQLLDIQKLIDDIFEKNTALSEQGDKRLAGIMADIEKIAQDAAEGRSAILAQTEEAAKELKESIKTAAARIEDFYEQSKLIDKSLELKEDLARKTDELKIELDRLEQRRAEVERLETQFTKIKRLEDDVNAKMRHFLTEEGRISLMEKNFERLMQTSHSVEEKLKHVTGADDTLQNMSIRLRQLDDAMRDVEEKYQRLEKKKLTLDATTERIDIHFKALEESEKKAEQCKEDASRLFEEIETIKNTIHSITEDNQKALEASNKVSVLDAELEHIEERIAQMQKAREWLAGVETRLDETYKQIQRDMKMKTMGSGYAQYSGSSSNSTSIETQEEVRKLKRQGWTNEQISRNKGISISEVQLILEIPPRI
ncbi:MAG: hypothetical protein LBD20_04395 [Spirochaetaceae bacterium]|nr:hypothetical protein [Spirochaetaceae bacterium]